jgi:hypothetical protein
MKNRSRLAHLLKTLVFSRCRHFVSTLRYSGVMVNANSRGIRALLFAAFAAICNSAASMATSPANEPYTVSFMAGENGICGTETMRLVAHGGKLYCGLSNWEDTPGSYAGPQVLVLDSPRGKWRVDNTFNRTQSNGQPYFQRVDSLQELTFNYDGQGNKLPAPVSLLVAGLENWAPEGGYPLAEPLIIYSRDDSSGTWIGAQLPIKSEAIRSFGLYHDPSLHIDYAFAGASSGFLRGVYNASTPGLISWGPYLEGANPPTDGRIMSFENFGSSSIYASSKPYIYQYTGVTPAPPPHLAPPPPASPPWQPVANLTSFIDTKVVYPGSGVRGLSTVDGGIRMIGGLEGPAWKAAILSFSPAGQDLKVDQELNINHFIEQTLGVNFTNNPGAKTIAGGDSNLISAYDNIPPVINPSNGQTVWLVGLGFDPCYRCPFPKRGNDSWFLSRTAPYKYTLHEIPSLGFVDPGTDPQLCPCAVRTMTVSPFPEDQGQVLYIGFYDTNNAPCHNTAHAYRVGLSTALTPASASENPPP